jgi:hypothetical protein
MTVADLESDHKRARDRCATRYPFPGVTRSEQEGIYNVSLR